MNKITIYTDGACRGNPGIGGWGVWFLCGEYDKKLNGFDKNTTNNRMELIAVIKALEAIKTPDVVITLFTDSKYVLNGINQWIKVWRVRNWLTSNKKAVKNIDLWQRVDYLNNQYNINWQWVKGHSGNKGNTMADALANQAIDNMR